MREAETHFAQYRAAREPVRNATQSFVLLGEAQVHSCKANLTVYHHLRSEWKAWGVLGRMERSRILPVLFMNIASELYAPPPPHRLQNRRKWRTASMDNAEAAKRSSSSSGASAPERSLHPCSDTGDSTSPDETVHVAFSADVKQIDGLVAALKSLVAHSAVPGKTCTHVFLLEHEATFIRGALQCAFGRKIEFFEGGFWLEEEFIPADVLSPEGGPTEEASSVGVAVDVLAAGAGAAKKSRRAAILLRVIDESRVSRQNLESRRHLVGGDRDVTKGFVRDTGNLQSLHNFVRFYLHEMLPTAVKRVIYLDVDVLIKKDLRELWTEGSELVKTTEATVCAVIRDSSPLTNYIPGILSPHMPTFIPMQNPAFNAGVLFVDLEGWRQRGKINHLFKTWTEARNSHGPEPLWRHGSQPLMLLLFHGEACKLSARWNVDGLGHRLNYPDSVLKNGGLFHWTGPLKPWKDDGVNRRLWEPYAPQRYCPRYSFRQHTTTCRPDSWHC